MSFTYKLSDSARTRPNTKQIVENLQYMESTSNEELEIEVPTLKKSPILFDADGNTENCFVEIIQSEDVIPDGDVEMGENGQYSIINVDPNITSCNEHPDMYLHKDKTLIKPGDKFDSHESFRLYIDGNAERWKYYYSCADSRAQSSGKEFYTYRCVYSKPKCDYKPKGLRKRAETLKTNCPCRIVLKRLSYNSKYLTAVFVCDHHNHELSQEAFLKLQHGRRLPPKLKEEIMGLLYLDVDPTIIRNYVQSVTGFVLRKSYFNHVARTMKGIDSKKLNLLYQKAEELKRTYGQYRNDDSSEHKGKRGPKKRVLEYYDVEPDNESVRYEEVQDDAHLIEENESTNKKSRLETCLQKLSYDDEVLQSVRKLQSSVQCETQDSPWIKQEHFIAANGAFQQVQDDGQETTVAELVDANNIMVMEAVGEDGENGGAPQHYILEKTDDTENGEFTAYPCEVLYENDQSVMQNEEVVANEEEVPNEASEVVVQSHDELHQLVQETVSQVPENTVQEDNEPYNVRADPSPDYEYIHRYNIDQYMKQPWFPKYIEKVAEDSRASIADMLCDLYWGKSMFRLVTTKTMGSKTIRISYMHENVPKLEVHQDAEKREYRYQASKHCKRVMMLKKKLADTSSIIRHLNDVLLTVKKENKELAYKNKLLENTRAPAIQNPRYVGTVYNKEINENKINNLRTKKQALMTDISEAEKHIAHLEEIKKNLKRDICQFVSKKVLLKRISGEQVDKLEEVKSILARAIRKSNREETVLPTKLN